ncbi:MAG: CDP-glycerol glycerophosphotransferase family protein [Eubacteriales bacterium]|nr:CDP-glycerol glycerophosphotransferase family protein [Eubacteriales bacterium]
MNWLLDKSGLFIEAQEIRWDHLHLYITVEVKMNGEKQYDPEKLDFYMVYMSGKARAKLDVTKISDSTYELHVNVTNNGANQCIPFGVYTIFVCENEDVLTNVQSSIALGLKLEERSRIFSYNAFHKAYNVQFFVDVYDETGLPLKINIRNLDEIPLVFPKNEDWKAQIKDIMINVKDDVRHVVRRMYRKKYKKYKDKRENTIVFLTTQSNQLVNNLSAVHKKMLERKLDSKFNILVYAHNTAGKPMVEIDWEPFIDTVAQARIIFIDDHVPAFDWLRLGGQTKLIQLWHAGAGFKSSGYNRWGNVGAPGPHSCHRQYAYGIAGSKKIASFFSDAWGINVEKVVSTGMPRMDSYLDKEYQKKTVEKLYEKYPICNGKKVILFAPTFRGVDRSTAYYPYELLDFEKLYQVCGSEYVVLFKAHPWVNNKLEIEEKYQDKFLDVSSYKNINDLFYITDLMITDYSSGIYEYSLMRKPMLFFGFDVESYSFSRGFHRSFEESAPGKVCYTFEEVIKAIEDKDFEYEKVEKYIEEHFDYFDTNACNRVIDWFVLGQLPAEITERIEKKRNEMKKMAQLDFTREEV